MRTFLAFFSTILFCGYAVNAQDKPKKAQVIYEEAEAAYNDDRYSQALELLDECLKEYPGHYEAYSLRGSVREIMKDNAGALTDYSIYLERFPENLSVLMSRAILRYRMGFYDQAKAEYIAKPDKAKEMAGTTAEKSDVANLAAWTAVGNVLLNLDETLMRP